MIKSIYFLPHGMQIIPGTEENQAPGFQELHQQMRKIVAKIKDDKIENIVLLTPHGYSLQEDFTFYLHKNYLATIYKLNEESVVHGSELKSFSIKGDSEFTEDLATKIAEYHGINTQGLVHGYPEYPMTLNWGCSVPLYYIQQFVDLPVSIICVPRIRHDDLVKTLERVQLISQDLINSPKTSALVVSGDLSHTHDENSRYGFDKASKEFDELVISWFNTCNRDILNQLIELQPKALSCGMIGMAVIQQIFDKSKKKYYCSDYHYEVPTYFGMGIARWEI